MSVGSGGRFGGVSKILPGRRKERSDGAPAAGPSAADVLADHVAGVRQPRVAVLVDGPGGGAVKAVRRLLPDARVTRVGAGAPAAARHARLSAEGPYDAVLDRTRQGRRRGALLKNAFWHLRPGGCYVVAAHAGALDSLLDRVARYRAAAEPRPGRKKRDLAALAAAIETTAPVGAHLVLVNRTAALAKIAERQADRVLALRGGDDAVLQTEPGVTFASRCDFTSNRARPGKMPETLSAPPLALRAYAGAVCVPGQVLVSDHLLLPDTYRHNGRHRLTNMHTTELARRFATVQADLEAAPLLEGTYFYLDNEVRGHFGHALTEQVSLLWGLAAARRHIGPLKVVMSGNRRRPELEPFELELFGAAGLAAEDIVLLAEPTRVERLVAATPALSMPQYVHPLIAGTWAEIGDALAARATLVPEHDRIFVGRRVAKRACRNFQEVEALFAERGFEVVYPEDYPLPDQVAMFRRAEVIAGYAGSGLFQTCLVPEPRTVVQIRAETYGPTNEYLMASVLGHRLVSVVGQTDRTEEEERRGAKRFQSSFRVDLDTEGPFLRSVLDAL